MKAATFRYRARTQTGDVVRGDVRASSRDEAVRALRARALTITDVDAPGGYLDVRRLFERRAHRPLLMLFRSLATLLGAGIPMRRALAVSVERCSDARLAEALRAVGADVEHGTSLSDALARRPGQFAALYVAMIRAGELGGILDAVVARIASRLEDEHRLRRKMQGALAYPAFVAVAALGLFVYLIASIVPTFAGLFVSFGVPLPLPTKILVSLGRIASSPLTWIGFGTISAVVSVAVVAAFRAHATRASVERLRLRLPVIGGILRLAISARTCRTFGTLLQSGVGLLETLAAVAEASGSVTYERALVACSQSLRAGETLRAALEPHDLVDPLTLTLVAVGEETGSLDEMFVRAADYLDVELDAAIATLSSVIEPTIIVVLGVLVGLIVFSIFIPLYSLIGSIS